MQFSQKRLQKEEKHKREKNNCKIQFFDTLSPGEI